MNKFPESQSKAKMLFVYVPQVGGCWGGRGRREKPPNGVADKVHLS